MRPDPTTPAAHGAAPYAGATPHAGAPAPEAALAARTADVQAGPARLLLLPTEVRDVVSFRGSLWTAPDLGTDDDLVQALTAELLDKGTRHRDRFAVAEALEGRGAQLSFYSDGLRVGFAGRALRADLPDVLALLAEQLREPALDADTFEVERTQALADVRRAMDQTGAQASGLLLRRLYPADHPNVIPEPADELARLAALTPEHVRAYRAAHVAPDRLTVAFAGDLDADATEAAAARAFAGWVPHGREPRYAADAAPAAPGRADRHLADRLNLDVRFGHAVPLRRGDGDFLALYAAVFALGGNFSARLMQTVRDEQGLTYGIGAGLPGVTVEHGGHWQVSVTLSQANLERGIEATRAELDRFVRDGLAADELAAVQDTLAGQHVVGLATTSGLAARLLVNAERGFPLDYLDRYPALVRALTLDEVNAAIRRHLRPDDLHVTVAGTLPPPGA